MTGLALGAALGLAGSCLAARRRWLLVVPLLVLVVVVASHLGPLAQPSDVLGVVLGSLVAGATGRALARRPRD
jgi:uncharacterized membrane protein YjjB (DUF3815 family)